MNFRISELSDLPLSILFICVFITTDAEAPQFLDCPTNLISRRTTPGEATANVTFNLPNATDNSRDSELSDGNISMEDWYCYKLKNQ